MAPDFSKFDPKTNNAARRFSAITSYDYPTARVIGALHPDIVLVGDSLGMVVLGFPDTTHVTLDHMTHHVSAVTRGLKDANSTSILVGDLPYATYETPEQALSSAQSLIDAGAHAVKLEGGSHYKPQLEAIAAAGIPILGHIGMLPQSVQTEGGYKKKGKTDAELQQIILDGQTLEQVGAFATVIESVTAETATQVTSQLSIPTIGIGAGGTTCHGEIAVLHDIVGASPWFVPPFAKVRAHLAEEIQRAVSEYLDSI